MPTALYQVDQLAPLEATEIIARDFNPGTEIYTETKPRRGGRIYLSTIERNVFSVRPTALGK